MTRLRYIIDRPRGPRGGNHDDLTATNSPCTACRRAREIGKPPGRVLVYDLDMLPELRVSRGHVLPLDFEDSAIDEEYEWHERMSLHHASEMERLRPRGELTPVTVRFLSTHDLAKIRHVLEEYEGERARRERAKRPSVWTESTLYLTLRDLWREGKLG